MPTASERHNWWTPAKVASARGAKHPLWATAGRPRVTDMGRKRSPCTVHVDRVPMDDREAVTRLRSDARSLF